MSGKNDVKITDESNDRSYFVIMPRLVWALSRNTYDLALWLVVKDIAGEAGECFLSTIDLAALAMMSVGQVTKSRRHLLDAGLLIGEVKRDPGYPQPVWHLRIPDLWQANLEWAENHRSIKDRVSYKKSVHQVKPSPGEEGNTPGEGGYTPGETKKNQKKNQKNNHPVSRSRNAESGRLPSGNGGGIDYYPKDVRPVIQFFCDWYNVVPPEEGESEFKLWIRDAREIESACRGYALQVLQDLKENPYDWMFERMIGRPGALTCAARSRMGEIVTMARNQGHL